MVSVKTRLVIIYLKSTSPDCDYTFNEQSEMVYIHCVPYHISIESIYAFARTVFFMYK